MKKFFLVTLLTLSVLLVGCAQKQETSTTADVEATDQEETQPEVTKEATKEAPKEDTVAQVTVAKSKPVLPVTENDTGKVLIQTVSGNLMYPFNSYIISSVNGENAVVDPTQMPTSDIVDINPAAIVSTHTHPDHTDVKYQVSYDCPQLLYTKGEIDTKDFHIFTFPSSHNGDIIKEEDCNVIVVFEVDGLRIAHMGDVGQTVLTEDQLSALGDIDIAFMQFENSYSSMDVENQKGFHLIEQLNPKIIIPTHFTDASMALLEEKYGVITEFDNILEISKDDLPDTRLNVYHILNNHKYN